MADRKLRFCPKQKVVETYFWLFYKFVTINSRLAFILATMKKVKPNLTIFKRNLAIFHKNSSEDTPIMLTFIVTSDHLVNKISET